MSDSPSRKDKRAPVTLKIKFKSASLEQFIERYSVDVSHGGIFIRTKDPLGVGTQIRFEFQLQDATPLIGGEGTVVWTREFDPTRAGVAPGMGVRFDKLAADSQSVLDKILAKKTRDSSSAGGAGGAGGGSPADREPSSPGIGKKPVPSAAAVAASVGTQSRAPSSVVPGGVPAAGRPVHKTIMGVGGGMPAAGKLAPPRPGFPDEPSKDHTPLPRPMPFTGVDDDVSEEVFELPTRVAMIDSLVQNEQAQARGGAKVELGVDSVDLPMVPLADPVPAKPAAKPMIVKSPAVEPTVAEPQRKSVAPPTPIVPVAVEAKPEAAPEKKPEPKAEVAAAAVAAAAESKPLDLSSMADEKTEIGVPSDMQQELEEDSESEPEAEVQTNPSAVTAPGRLEPDAAPRVNRVEPEAKEPKKEPAKEAAKESKSEPKPARGPRATPPSAAVTTARTSSPRAAARPVLVEEPRKPVRSPLLWPAISMLLFVGAAVLVYLFVIKKADDDTTPPETPNKVATINNSRPAVVTPGGPGGPAAPANPPSTQPAAVAPASAPAAPTTVDVDVTSVPAGAVVEIEGVQQAPTPTRLQKLDPSKTYKLVFKAACYKDTVATLQPSGSPLSVKLKPLERVVHVTTTPSDALVLVDGQSVGRSPTDVHLRGKLDPGQAHTFTFKKAGHDDTEVMLAPDVPCTMEKGVATVAVAQALPNSAPQPQRPVAITPRPSHADRPEHAPKPAAQKPGDIQVIDQGNDKPSDNPPPAGDQPKPDQPKPDQPKPEIKETGAPEAPTPTPKAEPAKAAPLPDKPAEPPAPKPEPPAAPKPEPPAAPKAEPPAAPKAEPPAPSKAEPPADKKPDDSAKPAPAKDKKPDCDPSPDAPDWARCK